MNSNKRVAVNTVVQYCRTAVNACMSLYIVRVVLHVLGQEDYGIYSLVGGIVAMMGFVTNAMIVTTQRHLSYTYGKAQKGDARILFSNSMLLHLAISGILVLALLLLRNPIFSHYLVIAPQRLDVARMVYVLSVAMLFLSFMTAPFKALFIARENIVYMSIVDVFDCFLKLLFALLLSRVEADKLLTYACMMLVVYLVQWLAFSMYAIIRFDECRPRMFFADRNWGCIRRLMSFAGWTTYGTTAIVLRNQGFAVILNHFLCSRTIPVSYQRSLGFCCLDSIVFQRANNTCGTLGSGNIAKCALNHDILDFFLSLCLEILRQILTLIITRSVLIAICCWILPP